MDADEDDMREGRCQCRVLGASYCDERLDGVPVNHTIVNIEALNARPPRPFAFASHE